MMQILQMNNQISDSVYLKNQEPIYIKRSRNTAKARNFKDQPEKQFKSAEF